MKTFFLILAASLSITFAQAQKAASKLSDLSFCEGMNQIKAAAESNFIPLTKTEYTEGTIEYTSKVSLPGFTENTVSVNGGIAMFYTGGNTKFTTLEEARAAFIKAKAAMVSCYGSEGVNKKSDRQPESMVWTSAPMKDFVNNTYKVETTLAVYQNTKTKLWALEYFIIRKK
jgi:hypothetical protein